MKFDLERIKTDEETLRKWHQPRINHLKTYRGFRDMDPTTSILDEGLYAKYPRLIKIISNRASLTCDWAIAVLAGQQFKYRNPFSNDAARDKSSIPEKIAYGIDGQVDALLSQRGTKEPRRYLMAKQVISGSIAWRPMLRESDDGVMFDIVFFDPATVFWLPGDMGLQTVIRHVEMTLLDAKLYVEANGGGLATVGGKETDKVQCTEYWTMDNGKVKMAFRVENRANTGQDDLAIPFHDEPGKQIPIICGSVNIPGVESTTQQSMEVFGHSILTRLIRSSQQANFWESLASLSALDHLFPTEVSETNSGQGVDNDATPGEQAKIDLKIGERFSYAQKPAAALDVRMQSEKFDRELDHAGVPTSVLGGLSPMPPSGFLSEVARFNAEVVKLAIFEDAFRMAEKHTMMWWLRHLRDETDGAVKLWGKHLERNGLDGYFEIDAKPGDIPKGYWEIVVEHDPARPTDELSINQVNSQREQMGWQSKRRSMEKAGIQDPEGELERLAREKIYDSPAWELQRQVSAADDNRLAAIANMKKNPKSQRAKREAAAAEAIFVGLDRQLGVLLSGGGAIQDAQSQIGREAPQPNMPMEPSAPTQQVQPAEFRGEGRVQKQALNVPGGRNGGM